MIDSGESIGTIRTVLGPGAFFHPADEVHQAIHGPALKTTTENDFL